MRKKNLEKEINSKNKEILEFKDTYNDLAKECISYEDENDKLLEKINIYRNYVIYLSIFLLLSNIILTFYIFLGPEKLQQDAVILFQIIRNAIFAICQFINNLLNLIFGMSNILKIGICVSTFLGFNLYKKYEDKIFKKYELIKNSEYIKKI